jgi:hypothetical protein
MKLGPRAKRYARLAVLVLVPLAVVAVIYDYSQEIRWVGGYRVQVRLERLSDRPVKTVSVVLMFPNEWRTIQGDLALSDQTWEAVDLTGGDIFEVDVRSGGRISGLGREISSVREEILVVRVEYEGGGTETVIANIPDYGSDRRVVVRVP